MSAVPGEFLARMEAYCSCCRSTRIDPTAVGCGRVAGAHPAGAPLAATRAWVDCRRWSSGTTASMLVPDCLFETIGSRFGGIPAGLPTFAIPQFRWI